MGASQFSLSLRLITERERFADDTCQRYLLTEHDASETNGAAASHCCFFRFHFSRLVRPVGP